MNRISRVKKNSSPSVFSGYARIDFRYVCIRHIVGTNTSMVVMMEMGEGGRFKLLLVRPSDVRAYRTLFGMLHSRRTRP